MEEHERAEHAAASAGRSRQRALRAYLFAVLALAVAAAGLALTVLAATLPASAAPLATQDLTQQLTPEQLAAALVSGQISSQGTIAGQGISISNVTYTGAPLGAGIFSGGSGVIGFEAGIILSSGAVRDVVGPNESDDLSTPHNTPGDPDLTTLSGFPTFDAATLEFDFVPAGSAVIFNYVFASEEYNEWVHFAFNDAFAFFVNGMNCATVGGQPVSVNTINNGTPFGTDPRERPELYINNDLSDGGGAFDTEMDGLTVLLTCQAQVMPNETNRMKLTIADASDLFLDSNVFIQAGSFAIAPTPTHTVPEGPAPTETRTPTATEMAAPATATPTRTASATGTTTRTPTRTATAAPPTTTRSPTPSNTRVPTRTATRTNTPGPPPTATMTLAGTATASGTPTATWTPLIVVQAPADTPTATETPTATPTETRVPTASPTPFGEAAGVTEPPDDGGAGDEVDVGSAGPRDIPRTTSSLLGPHQVSTDPQVIATNFYLAIILLLVLLFSSTMFNETVDKNRERLESFWQRVTEPFRRVIGSAAAAPSGRSWTMGALAPLPVVLVSGLIYTLAEPGVGFNDKTFVLLASMVLGVAILTYAYDGGEALFTRRRLKLDAGVKLFPLAILIAGFFVALSRLTDFQAPIMYGFVASTTLLVPAVLDKRQSALAVAVPGFLLLGLSVLAWLLLPALRDATGDSSSWWAHVPSGTAAILFAGGIEGLVFLMIPMRFTDGAKILSWNPWAWFVLFGVPAFLFSWVILNPAAQEFDALLEGRVIVALCLVAAYALVAIAVWTYFSIWGEGEGAAQARAEPPAL